MEGYLVVYKCKKCGEFYGVCVPEKEDFEEGYLAVCYKRKISGPLPPHKCCNGDLGIDEKLRCIGQ